MWDICMGNITLSCPVDLQSLVDLHVFGLRKEAWLPERKAHSHRGEHTFLLLFIQVFCGSYMVWEVRYTLDMSPGSEEDIQRQTNSHTLTCESTVMPTTYPWSSGGNRKNPLCRFEPPTFLVWEESCIYSTHPSVRVIITLVLPLTESVCKMWFVYDWIFIWLIKCSSKQLI